MPAELTKVEQSQVKHAKRSNVVLGHAFERLEALEEAMTELIGEVARDKTLSEKLKGWLSKNK